MNKLIKFYSKTCGPCKVLDTNLKQAGIEYDSVDINTEDGVMLATEYNVRTVPTLVLVDENNKEIKKSVGIIGIQKIKDFIA